MQGPFFSICIPAHDSVKYVDECLRSVMAQSYRNWEIVLVDDASADGLHGHLSDNGFLDSERLHYFRMHENKGPYYCRKFAFQHSRGSHIICLDADDELIGRDALERLENVISEQGPDVILFNMTSDKERLLPWIDYAGSGLGQGSPDKSSIIHAFVTTRALNNICARVIRRELLLPASFEGAAGLFVCEDRLELAHAFNRAQSFYLTNEPLYYYRPNETSTTHGRFKLEYCLQEALVESAVDNILSPTTDDEHTQMRLFLSVWAGDMEALSRDRTIAELEGCFMKMASNAFFQEAVNAVGTNWLRADKRVAIDLLRGNRCRAAARWVRLVVSAKQLVKRG